MRLIDADALMKDICDSINWMTDIGLAVDGDWLWAKLNDDLDNAPTIEVAPIKHGHWIVLHGVLTGDGIYGDMGECSNCGLHLRNYEWDYCPECGAKMDQPTTTIEGGER